MPTHVQKDMQPTIHGRMIDIDIASSVTSFHTFVHFERVHRERVMIYIP
jgi:hypothetical protein